MTSIIPLFRVPIHNKISMSILKKINCIVFLGSVLIFSEGIAEELPDVLSWEQVKTLPAGVDFELELDGYMSVFKVDGFWHLYFYDSRDSMLDHRRKSFVKINYEAFGKVIGFENPNVAFLKALDKRFVRIHARFRSPDFGASDYALEMKDLRKISWRNKEGDWSSSVEDCLKVEALTPGRNLKFHRAEFLK